MPSTETPVEDFTTEIEDSRHLFAWCLVHHGQVPEAQALEQARKRYPDQSPCREYEHALIFHDEPWHWAMLHMKGEGYWQQHRNWRSRRWTTKPNRTHCAWPAVSRCHCWMRTSTWARSRMHATCVHGRWSIRRVVRRIKRARRRLVTTCIIRAIIADDFRFTIRVTAGAM